MLNNKQERLRKRRLKAAEKVYKIVKDVTGESFDVHMMKVTEVKRGIITYHFEEEEPKKVDTFQIDAHDLCCNNEWIYAQMPFKNHILSHYVISINSILGNAIQDINAFNQYTDPEQLIGKRFFALVQIREYPRYFEGRRQTPIVDRKIYRVLPYVPYSEVMAGKKISARDIQGQEIQVKNALRIYRDWPKGL
ncbi:MAG: hypothetical protein Q8P75_00460 [bacterium]|nr:hypothetical protein [bacterium]